MKKIVVLAVTCLALAGCGTDVEPGAESIDAVFGLQTVSLDDGSTVECITYKTDDAGSLSGLECDWSTRTGGAR